MVIDWFIAFCVACGAVIVTAAGAIISSVNAYSSGAQAGRETAEAKIKHEEQQLRARTQKTRTEAQTVAVRTQERMTTLVRQQQVQQSVMANQNQRLEREVNKLSHTAQAIPRAATELQDVSAQVQTSMAYTLQELTEAKAELTHLHHELQQNQRLLQAKDEALAEALQALHQGKASLDEEIKLGTDVIEHLKQKLGETERVLETHQTLRAEHQTLESRVRGYMDAVGRASAIEKEHIKEIRLLTDENTKLKSEIRSLITHIREQSSQVEASDSRGGLTMFS